MSRIETIAGHIVGAIEAAPVSFQPWRHVFIENVFPEDFYQELEAAYPGSAGLFAPQVHTGDKDLFTAPYELRSEFRISKDPEIRKLQGETWDALWSVLNSRTFFVGLKRALAEDLLIRYEDYLGHPQFRDHLDPAVLVTKHQDGYYLGPHTDRSEKILTCIFNLPERDGLEGIGTTFYRHQQPDFRSNGRLHFGFDKFIPQKTTPFRRNSALLFARQDVSFHGVEPVTSERLQGSERRNIQFNLWDFGRRPS